MKQTFITSFSGNRNDFSSSNRPLKRTLKEMKLDLLKEASLLFPQKFNTFRLAESESSDDDDDDYRTINFFTKAVKLNDEYYKYE